MKDKHILLVLILVLFASSFCFAEGKKDLSFKATIAALQKALLEKNLTVLERHVDLEGIIEAKIKKLASQARKEKSFTSRLFEKALNFSEPALTKLAAHFVRKEYAKSSLGLRQRYLNTLKISKVKEKGQLASASGTFLGKPFVLSAQKINDSWVITRAESVIIDHELEYLLKYLRIRK